MEKTFIEYRGPVGDLFDSWYDKYKYDVYKSIIHTLTCNDYWGLNTQNYPGCENKIPPPDLLFFLPTRKLFQNKYLGSGGGAPGKILTFLEWKTWIF